MGLNISLVYLPSSHLLAHLVLTSSFLPVFPSVYFKSIVKKYCRVRIICPLQYLVPLLCWAKKWSSISKAKHHLDSCSSSSLLSTRRKLSSTFLRALQKKQLDPSLHPCSPLSAHEHLSQRIWAAGTWHCTCVVSMAIPRRAAQVESQIKPQQFAQVPHISWPVISGHACTCSCTTQSKVRHNVLKSLPFCKLFQR